MWKILEISWFPSFSVPSEDICPRPLCPGRKGAVLFATRYWGEVGASGCRIPSILLFYLSTPLPGCALSQDTATILWAMPPFPTHLYKTTLGNSGPLHNGFLLYGFSSYEVDASGGLGWGISRHAHSASWPAVELPRV